MNKNKIMIIVDYTVDFDKAKQIFHLSSDESKRVFEDGRFISPLSECWCAHKFNCKLGKKDKQGIDILELDENGEPTGSRFSVKALTNGGTAVRLSSNTGTKRTCDETDVKTAIYFAEAFIFVDNTRLPKLFYIQIPRETLLGWLEKKLMSKKSGHISYKKFYKNLYLERCRIDKEPDGLFPQNILKKYGKSLDDVFGEKTT